MIRVSGRILFQSIGEICRMMIGRKFDQSYKFMPIDDEGAGSIPAGSRNFSSFYPNMDSLLRRWSNAGKGKHLGSRQKTLHAKLNLD